MSRVLIAGCGYVGARLGEDLAREGHEVFGLRRNPRTLPPTITPIAADLGEPAAIRKLPADLDTVFYLLSPSGREEAQYRRAYVDGLESLLRGFRFVGQTPRRLLFASSTAVYAQSDGEWIDEDSRAEPAHFRGRRLLEAEAVAQRAPSRSIVVRFGGIYGPRRTGLIDRVRTGQATYREDPPHYTNRIHRDDCAGALRHLMQIDDPAPLYLGVDSEPAEEKRVLFWLAGAIGSPEPRRAEKRERGPNAPGSKRCRNRRLVQSGYTFRYPSFREGYRAVLQEIV